MKAPSGTHINIGYSTKYLLWELPLPQVLYSTTFFLTRLITVMLLNIVMYLLWTPSYQVMYSTSNLLPATPYQSLNSTRYLLPRLPPGQVYPMEGLQDPRQGDGVVLLPPLVGPDELLGVPAGRGTHL